MGSLEFSERKRILTNREVNILVNLLADKIDDLHEFIQVHELKGNENYVDSLRLRYEVYEQILLKLK